MNKKKSILIVTTSLDLGGITSFLIGLANEIYRQGNDVTIAYTNDNADLLKQFDPNIRFYQYFRINKIKLTYTSIFHGHFLDLLRIKYRNPLQISPISSIQRIAYDEASTTVPIKGTYDVVISSAEFFCNAFVALKMKAKLKIGWVHPDIKALPIDRKASRLVLDRMDSVVTVSEAGLSSLKEMFPRYSLKFHYIENILDIDKIRAEAKELVEDMNFEEEEKKIVTVCRIDNSSKRLDRVVRISEILCNSGFKFKWFIIGDGKDYIALKQAIITNNLDKYVILLGKKTNPYPYIKRADVFVLTSQYEGKPVVIDEAKALYTPVIVTEYSSSREQVLAENGVVVSNRDGELEQEIAEIITDGARIDSLKEKACLFEYSNDLISAEISNLLNIN